MTKADLAYLTDEALAQAALHEAGRAMVRSFLEDRYGPDMVTEELVEDVLEAL